MIEMNETTHPVTSRRLQWTKRTLLLLILLLFTPGLSAQTRKGVSFGVDRDTLLWLIASPFDNWWINVDGGIETFIGNEQDAAARWNTINPRGSIEVGKWVIPDVAISLRATAFHSNSQGCYNGLNPWLDMDKPTSMSFLNEFYHEQSVHGIAAMGILTFDWTNFFEGYERGKRTRMHIYTPIGMGGIWLYGKQINTNANNRNPEWAGKTRWNKELAFMGSVMSEYFPKNSNIALHTSVELIGTRGTLDWTYAQDDSDAPHKHRVVDWIPSVNFGVKFNLLKQVTKRDPYTDMAVRSEVYHEFRTVGSQHEINRRLRDIERYKKEADSLRSVPHVDTTGIAARINELENIIDSLENLPRPPANVIEDLMQNDLALTVVYFELDKYNLDRNARYRLRRFAKEMERYDDTVEFYIIGGADSLTGSKRHNDWLSEKRCQVAFDALVNNYGADRNRLNLVPVGGITVYEPKEENRMAMIVIKNKESDAIIEKWTRYKK
mgnify:CR=1 FL=1